MQDLFRKWFPRVGDDADNAYGMGKKPKIKAVDIDLDLGRHIAALRVHLRQSQAEFGERFGVSQVTVSRWEKGLHPARKHWRKIETMLGNNPNINFQNGERNALPQSKIGDIVQEGSDKLSGERTPVAVYPEGAVGAGQWLEVQDNQAPSEPIFVLPSKWFPKAKVRAFPVEGDSMDQVGIIDGDYVIGADFVSAGAQLQTGMIVVVEQVRDGGQLYRRTLKEVHVFRDHYELRPRSSNPKHQTINVPITYFDPQKPEDANEEIRVLAIVTGRDRDIDPFGGPL